MSKARGLLAKAKYCEERAKKTRDTETREWETTLARVYRILAEAENEVVEERPKLAAKLPANLDHSTLHQSTDTLLLRRVIRAGFERI